MQREASSGLQLEAEIEDTGIGISEDDLGRMFQYFEQTQSGRRAAPVPAWASRLAANLCGSWVETSRCGASSDKEACSPSAFSCRLAESSAPKGLSFRRVQRLKLNQPKFRVLIADDKEDNRVLLSRLLEPVGFELREAVNGVEAIRGYEEWRPHLILMDVMMPVVDGNEAVRDIRERFHDHSVKIITLSASTFEQDRQKALAAGSDDFIGKPFRQPELLEKIRALLGAEYVYEDEVVDSAQAGLDPRGTSLSKLPRDLLARISDAARVGEFDRVTDLIAEAALVSPQAAAKLGRFAEEFDSDNLLRLIQAHPQGGE